MKTANRHLMLGVGLVALSLSAGSMDAWAQTNSAVTSPPVVVPAANSETASAAAHVNVPSVNPAPVAAASAVPAKTVVATADSAPPPAPTATLPKENADADESDPDDKQTDAASMLPGAKKGAKNSDENGPKVPASVKGAIKNLKVKSEDLTLDDLNAAREAIAKLDALIDIEKRLVELDKVRKERENESNKAMMAAIPASALAPPFSYMPPPQQQRQVAQAAPAYMTPASVDVERIEGSNSHYLAFIKEGDSVHQVQTGDHLSDGSIVTSISPRGIELKRDQTSHLVQVKDVQAVFGDSP